MLESKHIYIYGYSGHSYVVIDILERNNFIVKGYFDVEPQNLNPYELSYSGFEGHIKSERIVDRDYVFPALGDNQLREKIVTLFTKHHMKQIQLIDPSAYISSKASVGLSSLVGLNACVNSMVKIGKGCIINTAAIIEHECTIGDFSHIAPGAVLTGGISIGQRTFIGAGAVIKNGITIGNDVVVGAGAVVLKNIPNKSVWVGNPAKKFN